MKILAIETSCDETAIAIIEKTKILFNEIFSQFKLHRKYNGIVPEMAARSHVDELPYLLNNIYCCTNLYNLDAFVATGGPGLASSIIIGIIYAKCLAIILKKKFIAINHLEGHALVVFLINYLLKTPYLLLLISGGHCQIIIIHSFNKYEIIGNNLDDSIGEIFDKIACLLKCSYPGGPKIEKYALLGNEKSFLFPVPLIDRKDCNFSFSGLKTAILREIKKNNTSLMYIKSNMCSSFQKIISDILIRKLYNSSRIFGKKYKNIKKNILISGGVASNIYIRKKINSFFFTQGFKVTYPPIKLCTDNGIMIAYVAYKKFLLGYKNNLYFTLKSKWPISRI